MLCGDGGNIILFQIRFKRNIFIYYSSLQYSKWIKQYFPCERLNKIGERHNKKNTESLNSTWKINLLRLWRGKCFSKVEFRSFDFFLSVRYKQKKYNTKENTKIEHLELLSLYFKYCVFLSLFWLCLTLRKNQHLWIWH